MQIGKRWDVSTVSQGGQLARRLDLWGGYEDVIQLSDTDEGQDDDDDDDEDHDHDHDHDGDQQNVAAKGRRQLKCPKPSCGQTYAGGILKRLRRHIDTAHADDPELEQYRREVEDTRPNKTPKQECDRCGKMIAGRGSQMKSHQNSSKCL